MTELDLAVRTATIPNTEESGATLPSDAQHATLFEQIRDSRVLKAGAVLGGLMLGPGNAAPALAGTSNPNEIPAGVTMVTRTAEAKAKDVATKRLVVGEDVLLKRGTNTKKCYWDKNFTNSMRLANGKLHYYPDTNGKLCRNPNSPTGWVKVAGGKTGRKCWNPAKPSSMPKGRTEVLNVRDLDTSFTLRAVAIAPASAECPGASASAYARGEVTQRFRLRSYLRMKGTSQASVSFRLFDEAKAQAEASAKCTSTTETQPPQSNPTPEPSPTPTPQPSRPPVVDLVDQQHNRAGYNVQVCAYGSDQDNDIVYQEMTESGDGNFTSNIYAGNEPGEFCRDFAPGTAEGTAVITAKVRDSKNNEASDTESWPIVDQPFRAARQGGTYVFEPLDRTNFLLTDTQEGASL